LTFVHISNTTTAGIFSCRNTEAVFFSEGSDVCSVVLFVAVFFTALAAALA
jgi:hypothetical protein